MWTFLLVYGGIAAAVLIQWRRLRRRRVEGSVASDDASNTDFLGDSSSDSCSSDSADSCGGGSDSTC